MKEIEEKSTLLNWSFWLSIIAICFSSVALLVFIFKVTPNSVVDGLTFISIIAAFIGLSVTLLVGYQIYNVIDVKQKINNIERLKKSLKQQQKQLESFKIEQMEGFEILQARLFSSSHMEGDALIHFHSALKFSLSVNHKDDGYKWMLDELKEYMLNINNSIKLFHGCINISDYQKQVKKLRDYYKDNDHDIRKHENYFYIKDIYEELMSKFEKRLDNISRIRNVSPYEIDKLLDASE